MAKQIQGFLDNVIPKEHQWKIILFRNWDNIIGSLKGKVRIEKLEKNHIVLGVSHPAWAQELYMLTNVIKDKINSYLSSNTITDIRFRTVSFKPKKKKKTVKHVRANVENVAFNQDEKASLNNVKNKELRNILEKYYIRCKSQ